MKKILTTPIREEDILDLRIGDIVYLTGTLATCRDTGHKHRVLKGNIPKLDLTGGAVFHAGPITRKRADGGWDMISVGPTTSMRMERFEKEFLEMTGTKLLIGKGGMGEKTTNACKDRKVIHTVFPGGCAVIAASEVEEITDLEWEELGMPEAFWVCKVKEFGPLIVSIDTEGNNLFENNKKIYRERKENAMKEF